MDGAFARLSRYAAGYWPSVIFDLAHETVRLLDPVMGITNWLEEGAAVAFSIRMSRELTSHPMAAPPGSVYATAHELVLQLPPPIEQSLGALRKEFGPFSTISSDQLANKFQLLSKNVCDQLAPLCQPRLLIGA